MNVIDEKTTSTEVLVLIKALECLRDHRKLTKAFARQTVRSLKRRGKEKKKKGGRENKLEALDEGVEAEFSLIPVVEDTDEVGFIGEFELDEVVEDLLLCKIDRDSRN